MMNRLRLLLIVGTATLLGGAPFALGQSPAALDLQLFAGVEITGTVGNVYAVQSTADLAQSESWTTVAFVQLTSAKSLYVDTSAAVAGLRLYRAIEFAPPNMVYIPPTTFRMGSPASELDHQTDESPQTTVTLTRGYWIGKYEVTQAEYLDVMGANPSEFPGDLNQPVSSVSWPHATNYCWTLTQRELAAGRIPAGSRFRLPTEAEWECAARAGTSTRFSYGDDPDNASITNYAWQSFDGGMRVHPVGQKLPNPWGLYDIMGNVFEWCQDWLGPLPGGQVTDPQGPPSNQVGWKVMRGGAFDFGPSSCRSASRGCFGNHEALVDWNLGFRVVLVCEP